VENLLDLGETPGFRLNVRAHLFADRHARLMFVRLIRSRRLLAGWIAAAIYLVCVITPAAALAAGSGPAPCFADDVLPVAHTHADGHGHDHGANHAHHRLADEGTTGGHHHDGKGLPGPCCVMLCAVAIPAELPTVTAPLRPAALRIAEAGRSLTGRTPPRLYRPPIA
jgi:hypothetical protein